MTISSYWRRAFIESKLALFKDLAIIGPGENVNLTVGSNRRSSWSLSLCDGRCLDR